MNEEQYGFIADFLKQQSGLVLTPEKIYLIESRMLPVARRYQFEEIDDFIGALRDGTDRDLIRDVTDAMTINETYFFRDERPFMLFQQTVLPELIANRTEQKKLKIWCAATAMGQEPYSLAMILTEESHQMPGWRNRIVATDISTEALTKAEEGVYTPFEVARGLPTERLARHFLKDGDNWRVVPGVRSLITFQHFNLLHSAEGLGKFDVVFCRNVLIYFDEDTKRQVLERISETLTDDGLLFVGASETVSGITGAFEAVPGQRGLFKVVK